MADTEKKSRSQIKREMKALQKLGERLVGLSPGQLKQIPLEPELTEAVNLARKLKKREAKRRQLQYIGHLMRRVNPEPIRSAFERLDRGQRLDTLIFIETEKWRDRLLTGDETLIRTLTEQFEDLDTQRINRLIQNARAEKEAGRPPRAARTLFRYLATFARRWLDKDQPQDHII